MRITPLPLLLLAAAVAAPAAGCGSMGTAVPSSRELSTAQFDDVPVPRGFVLDLSEGRSYSYAEGGGGPAAIRMGRLEYTGLGTASEVLAWYASEMTRTIHGWGAGEAPEDGGPSLLFRGKSDLCLVTVRTEGSQLRVVVERNTGGAIGRD